MDIKAKTAALSIISNTALVVFKLTVGLMINSVSVVSEAIHSGSDLLASFIAFYSVKVASKPADEKHKYGHGKVENIAATIEAILILTAALWIIYESYKKLMHMEEVNLVLPGVLVMLVSAAVNYVVSKRLYKVAHETDSVALEADALHLKTDVYTSLGIVFGLIAIRLTGFHWLDPLAAIIVAFMIIKASFNLFREAFFPLMDTSLPEEEENIIKSIIASHADKFINFHRLRTRKAGSEKHIDLHLVVPKCHDVQKAYDLSSHIRKDIEGKIPRSEVLIHIEPCNEPCDKYCGECEKSE